MLALSNKVATKITAALDNAATSMFGGKLQKATLMVYECNSGDVSLTNPVDEIPFLFNPHTIKVDKEVEFAEEATANSTKELKYSATKPVSLELGEIWFDTYETRESVREKYIDKLEALLDYQPGTHVLHVIKFVWGEFSMGSKLDEAYAFLAAKISVEYTLFLPSGRPCRAKVALCLRQIMTASKESKLRNKQSPDHARIYTVKRGDTLQGIATFAYEDPRQWRRIANSNDIPDPMTLRPGTVLMLPPILK